MVRRWLTLIQIVLVCISAWELWSIMGCPQNPMYCPDCTMENRQPAGCGWACTPVKPKGPYQCCCPAVWSGGPGGVPRDCCVATCVYYECAPIIPGSGFLCPSYDLDFTPSHCAGMPYCVTTGPYPLQGHCSSTHP